MTMNTAEAKGAIVYGVPIAGGQHLLVAGRFDDRLLILSSTRMAQILGRQLPDLSQPGAAASALNQIWRQYEGWLWTNGLDRAFGRLLATDRLIAKDVLAGLGGYGPRTLHLAAFNTDGQPVGGYSIRLEPGPGA
jgi:hypothetical protein